jgi:hypothetical protein
MQEVNGRSFNEILRARDPNLPLLASQAAIELDNLILSKSTELSATRQLGTLLSKSFGVEQGVPSIHSLSDPGTMTVVSRALLSSITGAQVRTVSDLAREAAQVAVKLRDTGVTADRESLEFARAFCVALSECAASYLQSRYSQLPAHPNRR